MGIVRMGVPEDVVIFLKDNYEVKNFIETGTYEGETAKWASVYFNVYTIEQSKIMYEKVVAKYKNSKINFIFGNSREKLKGLFDTIDGPIIFWLDAHWSGGDTYGQNDECPLLDEIKIINEYGKGDIFILIDDARLFLAPPPEPHNPIFWPTIQDLTGLFNKDRFYITIFEDVIIIVPNEAKGEVVSFIQRKTTCQASERTDSERNSKDTNFTKEFIMFKNMQIELKDNRFEVINWDERYPCLDDKTLTTEFDTHYIYHPAWAARILSKIRPKIHVDISSALHFSTIISAFIPVKFYDYRPAQIYLEDFSSYHVDISSLQFEDDSIESISCMHVVEHIGLGRYGDQLDPYGDLKAIEELKRVLAVNGNLLFVVPVGKTRIQFNAHRIYSYSQIIDYFSDMKLIEFSLIPDNASKCGLVKNATQQLSDGQYYGCGCFWFTK